MQDLGCFVNVSSPTVCCLSFDFVYGVFITHRLLVCIVSNEFFMVSGFCVRFRASIILEYEGKNIVF